MFKPLTLLHSDALLYCNTFDMMHQCSSIILFNPISNHNLKGRNVCGKKFSALGFSQLHICNYNSFMYPQLFTVIHFIAVTWQCLV